MAALVFVSSRCKRGQLLAHQVAILIAAMPMAECAAALEQQRTGQHTLAIARWPHSLTRVGKYVDRSQVDYHPCGRSNTDGIGAMVYYGNLHPSTVMI